MKGDETRETSIRRAPLETGLEGYWPVFHASPVGIAINALDGRFIDVNPSALRMFGRRREDLVGRTSTEVGLLQPGDPKPTALAAQVRERGAVRNEQRTVHSSSGETHDVLLLVDLVELRGESCFLSTFLDVTDHKRNLEKLEASEARYRQIVETAREGICISDREGRFTFVNSRLAELFGYRPDEMLGMSVFAVVAQAEAPKVEWLLERRRLGIAEGGDVKLKHRDGHDLWVRFESSPIFDSSDQYIGALTAILDITDRIRVEERLRKSEALLEEAQALAHVGSWEWDLMTDTVSRSTELCRIFGICPETFGTSPSSSYDRVHPDDRERLRTAIERATRDRQPWEIEYRIVRPDGVRFLLACGEVISDAEGRPVRMVGTAQDITERREMEARFVLADRMASVGTLAAGMAHEINNPLAYLIGNLDLVGEALARRLGSPVADDLPEIAEMIKEAREGAERVRKIVRDVKTFSRAGEDRRVSVEPTRVLDLAVDIARPEIRYRARLVKEYGPIPAIDADEARLGQVFVNLLINAAHAIPEGQMDKNEIRISTRTDADGRAVVEVRDTGVGISAEMLGRVFDPFFTTKPIGVGSGLGLSICHGIVAGLGGEIDVESEPGKGSVFRVVLPRGSLDGAADMPRASRLAEIPQRGRVLVIDDEPLIGAVIRRLLRDHDVTAVTNGRDALARIASGEHFDLIFCDLMMPEMTGMDLHAEMSRAHPELLHRVVFITGGVFSSSAKSFLDRVPNERLEKPFDPSNLKALAHRFSP